MRAAQVLGAAFKDSPQIDDPKVDALEIGLKLIMKIIFYICEQVTMYV